MTEDKEIEKNLKDLDDICDECKKENETVFHNLILTGFKICFVEIINPAKIQNCVRKIIVIIRSGVTAKNLNKPGAWANPIAVSTFLKDVFVCLSGKILTPNT